MDQDTVFSPPIFFSEHPALPLTYAYPLIGVFCARAAVPYPPGSRRRRRHSLSCVLRTMPSSSNSTLFDKVPASTDPFARLSTNTTTSAHPVHRWFNFIAGFSPELVRASVALETTRSATAMCVLDPFSGCGTAPVAARLLGLSAIAYEPHPFFATISEAKANSHRYWYDVPRIHAAILEGIARPGPHVLNLSSSATAFLNKMFRKDDLLSLCSARTALADTGLDTNPLAILILSRVLDYCCLAATDGIYKAPTSARRALSPSQALHKVFTAISRDKCEALYFKGLVRIYEKSSQKMSDLSDDSIDIVVTSPPYLNNFDFAEMTRMYLYFWGIATSWKDITTRVRSRLIVNTTTALPGHRQRQELYRRTLPTDVRHEADAVVSALSQRRKLRAGKKDYNMLIYPYLSQMQQVLREIYRVLKPSAPFHMMVSDAALYGVHVPTPQWFAQMMTEWGFTDVQCELVRARGHRWTLAKREGSPQGLGEYHLFGRAQ